MILSDLHFSDGTLAPEGAREGWNIPARAFRYLADDLRAIIGNERINVREVRLVLLGDVFDLLRSASWGRPGPAPWDAPYPDLEARAAEILEGVVRENDLAFSEIRDWKEMLGLLPERVHVHYVPGNHDRLVNLFPSTRRIAAGALGLDPGVQPPDAPFAHGFSSAEYGVLARHGQQFDGLNWGGSFEAAGLGEAVVARLFNAFPERARALLDPADPETAPILERLEELDHVRPLWAVPRWFQGMLASAGRESTRAALRAAWSETAAAFAAEPFVHGQMSPWNPLARANLAARLIRTPWGLAERLCRLRPLRWLIDDSDAKYARAAAEEAAAQFPDRSSQFPAEHGVRTLGTENRELGTGHSVVYGHTHVARQVAIDVRGDAPLMYFNSGTWRRVVGPAELGPSGATARPFASWQVMSYLLFYRPEENRGYRFETWQGTRG
ncbi:MAG TPA: hypothetical protein PK280_00560 [Planctomycetota bacterium]|nr:hypothetical protein [Planctomycetota bacterium]